MERDAMTDQEYQNLLNDTIAKVSGIRETLDSNKYGDIPFPTVATGMLATDVKRVTNGDGGYLCQRIEETLEKLQEKANKVYSILQSGRPMEVQMPGEEPGLYEPTDDGCTVIQFEQRLEEFQGLLESLRDRGPGQFPRVPKQQTEETKPVEKRSDAGQRVPPPSYPDDIPEYIKRIQDIDEKDKYWMIVIQTIKEKKKIGKKGYRDSLRRFLWDDNEESLKYLKGFERRIDYARKNEIIVTTRCKNKDIALKIEQLARELHFPK